jgi:DNA-binding response OmpR family regulator
MSQYVPDLATIVVCEEDDATLDLLCEHLTADRFQALPAPTAVDALRFCRYNQPDLLLLDLALPDGAAFDAIRDIRGADGIEVVYEPTLPIIVLTGRSGADRVRGMDVGADDYVQKPFSYEELRTRVRAVLRRRHSRHDQPVKVGELHIDPARRQVTVGDRDVRLGKKEFDLLRVLATDPTRVFSKDELLRDVWGLKAPAGSTRTLDSHASRLRRKLDPDDPKKYVVNCWGIGYRLVKG